MPAEPARARGEHRVDRRSRRTLTYLAAAPVPSAARIAVVKRPWWPAGRRAYRPPVGIAPVPAESMDQFTSRSRRRRGARLSSRQASGAGGTAWLPFITPARSDRRGACSSSRGDGLTRRPGRHQRLRAQAAISAPCHQTELALCRSGRPRLRVIQPSRFCPPADAPYRVSHGCPV